MAMPPFTGTLKPSTNHQLIICNARAVYSPFLMHHTQDSGNISYGVEVDGETLFYQDCGISG